MYRLLFILFFSFVFTNSYLSELNFRDNLTIALVDSSINGFGMFSARTKPVIMEDDHLYLSYRQYPEAGTSSGQIGSAIISDLTNFQNITIHQDLNAALETGRYPTSSYFEGNFFTFWNENYGVPNNFYGTDPCAEIYFSIIDTNGSLNLNPIQLQTGNCVGWLATPYFSNYNGNSHLNIIAEDWTYWEYADNGFGWGISQNYMLNSISNNLLEDIENLTFTQSSSNLGFEFGGDDDFIDTQYGVDYGEAYSNLFINDNGYGYYAFVTGQNHTLVLSNTFNAGISWNQQLIYSPIGHQTIKEQYSIVVDDNNILHGVGSFLDGNYPLDLSSNIQSNYTGYYYFRLEDDNFYYTQIDTLGDMWYSEDYLNSLANNTFATIYHNEETNTTYIISSLYNQNNYDIFLYFSDDNGMNWTKRNLTNSENYDEINAHISVGTSSIPGEIFFTYYVPDYNVNFYGNEAINYYKQLLYVGKYQTSNESIDFSASQFTGEFPLEIQFSSYIFVDGDLNQVQYAWDFDNNGEVDSNLPNPVHTYDSPNYYSVNLSVTIDGEVYSVTKNEYINVTHTEEPQISYIIDVPDDQGGFIYMSFSKSLYDIGDSNESYEIQYFNDDLQSWFPLVDQVAYGQNNYMNILETPIDSTNIQLGLINYRVLAAMDEGVYISEPMTGYSVDNSVDDLSNNLSIPTEFALKGCYPNPFNSTTTITYQVPEFANVSIDVYNLNGQLVEDLYKGFNNPGEHSVNWNAVNVTSGAYLIRMTSGSFVETQKVMLLK